MIKLVETVLDWIDMYLPAIIVPLAIVGIIKIMFDLLTR